MLDPDEWLTTDWGKKAVERATQRARMLLNEAGAFRGEIVKMATRESAARYQDAIIQHLEDQGVIHLVSASYDVFVKGAKF